MTYNIKTDDPTSSRDLVEGGMALNLLANWIRDMTGIPAHDHFMLFSG
jgi:hypothetical protein